MPATKNKKVSPPKRGKRPSPTKSTKQNEEKAAANRQLAAIILFAVSVFFICLSFTDSQFWPFRLLGIYMAVGFNICCSYGYA